jgi:hypothetical protein
MTTPANPSAGGPGPSAPEVTTSAAQVVQPYPPPNLLKGALIAAPRGSSATTSMVVPFQYNPGTMVRTLKPRSYDEEGERFSGPADQSIDVTVQLEASGDPQAAAGDGVLGYLASLELMIYPSSDELDQWKTKTAANKMSVVPPLAPRSLFVWGPKRVLPVRLTSMTVTEKLFGPNLSPVLAEVALKMDVYPFDEAGDKDYQLILSNMKELEKLRSAVVPASGVDIGITNAGSL